MVIIDLGTLAYAPALDLQRAVASARISGALTDDVLLLVEHSPVITLGRGTKAANLLASAPLLEARGVELFEVERGGDATYHGPGQLVGYPIFDLKQHRQDLHWYLRSLEEALIQALAKLGLPAGRNPGFTGVWTSGTGQDAPLAPDSPQEPSEADWRGLRGRFGMRKIASIGVHARDWVTWHGFALNVTTDLTNFDLIVPCGIEGVTMTTVQREIPDFPGERAVRDAVVSAFSGVFGREVSEMPPSWLWSVLEPATAPNA